MMQILKRRVRERNEREDARPSPSFVADGEDSVEALHGFREAPALTADDADRLEPSLVAVGRLRGVCTGGRTRTPDDSGQEATPESFHDAPAMDGSPARPGAGAANDGAQGGRIPEGVAAEEIPLSDEGEENELL